MTEPTAPSQDAPPATQRVLVVDDEERVLGVAVRMLEAYGFAAAGVATGTAALEALTSAELPFDAIVLDYGLPDFTAQVLIARLRTIAPRTPIVMISGHPIAIESVPGVACVLRKPFTMDRLAGAVQAALRGA